MSKLKQVDILFLSHGWIGVSVREYGEADPTPIEKKEKELHIEADFVVSENDHEKVRNELNALIQKYAI